MRKIFTLLCGVLLAAQFTTVSAQTTTKMKVYKTDGTVEEFTTSEVDSVSFSTTSKEDSPSYITVNGHKFVDLGLPSGLLWAETNIDAESAADYGKYFAWGETTSKSRYTWETYKYGTSEDNLTKYNSTDGKTVLDKEDDAAYVNWGDSCRMPTINEFAELRDNNNCTWTWTSQTNSSGSEVEGYKVTSTKNGNSIFMPAVGFYYGDNIRNTKVNGGYWSTSLDSSTGRFAFNLYFDSYTTSDSKTLRFGGYAIRPVAEK